MYSYILIRNVVTLGQMVKHIDYEIGKRYSINTIFYIFNSSHLPASLGFSLTTLNKMANKSFKSKSIKRI